MPQSGNILLADDEETFLEATADLLQDEGFDCSCVRNADELASALKMMDYDLLITDLNMPGNRVLEMVEETRTRSMVIPVIVVTGYPSVPSAVESVRLQVLDYLIKPIEFSKLLSSVKRGIQHKHVLQAVRKARGEAARRAEKLEHIERTLNAFGHVLPNASATHELLADPQFKQVQALLVNLVEMTEKAKLGSEGDPSDGSLVKGSRSGPEFYKLREGIFYAIDVLQRTKGSFRSKELADLRKYLQNLLKQTKKDE